MNIEVKGACIRLGQFLKIADLVGTGGEAKMRIQAGEIKVNGAQETRRGLQMNEGDIVEVEGKEYTVRYV